MTEFLKDAGKHSGTFGDGHYEVSVQNDGSVVINTILDNAKQVYTVTLNRQQWSRLASWVAWAQTNWNQNRDYGFGLSETKES